jgi:hypothetical protein
MLAMVRSGSAAGIVNIGFPGTPPRGLRFRLRTEGQELPGAASGAASGVLVRVRFASPQTHELRGAGGQKFTPTTHATTPVSTANPAGSASWDNPSRTLTFVVKGGADVEIITLDSVQVSLKLATTMSDFYDKGGEQTFISNIAYSLGRGVNGAPQLSCFISWYQW